VFNASLVESCTYKFDEEGIENSTKLNPSPSFSFSIFSHKLHSVVALGRPSEKILSSRSVSKEQLSFNVEFHQLRDHVPSWPGSAVSRRHLVALLPSGSGDEQRERGLASLIERKTSVTRLLP
jgi:hypothetical protein